MSAQDEYQAFNNIPPPPPLPLPLPLPPPPPTTTTTTVSLQEEEEEEQRQQRQQHENGAISRGICGKKKLSTIVIIRILIRILVIIILITLIVTLKINLRSYIDSYVSHVNTLGSVGAPVVFALGASLWCGLSPMGYLPTVIAGLTFSWYIAPLVAYISVNLGSLLNIILIRYIVLKYYCCQNFFKILFGEKMGKISYLEKVLILQPIKIVALARFPYLSNGVFNYMFSLSSVKLKDCAIGNAIGFIPGSILFSIFGSQVRSLTTIIDEGVDNSTQLALFIIIWVVALVSYGILVWKVRKLLRRAAENEQDNHVELISKDDEQSSIVM